MNKLKTKISSFNYNIKEMALILKDITKNMDKDYKNKTNKKYQMPHNNNNKITILSNINELINDNNTNKRYNNIINLYKKMKEDEIKDEIILKYKIEQENPQILGEEFVKNNKGICKIIYENKEYDLRTTVDLFSTNRENLEVKLIGISKVTNMSYMFDNCDSLLNLSDISNLDTSNVTDISHMFHNCNILNTIPDISKWNTKNIINMSYLFCGCASLLSLPNISKWDTSSVTNMSYMFFECSLLLSLPDFTNWDTHKVKDFNHIFSNCELLTSLPDISK